jgi:hypothetical protein
LPGIDQCHHGRITKQGRSSARWLAVEAAQSLSQMSTPLAATYHRVKRKRGHNVAVTALARKLVVLVWHVLRKQKPYRYGPVAHTRKKLRQVPPGLAPAQPGRVPHTLEAVYEEVGLPVLSAPHVAEKRTASVNLRTVTLARKHACAT